MKRGTSIIIFLAILTLLIVPMISAGFFSDFWGKITGRVSSKATNVSITISGPNPAQITAVDINASYTPLEINLKSITFYATMYDVDGVGDLNDSSVNASFNKTGETTRYNSSCAWLEDLDTTSANYSCTIDIWYWDGNGAWTVNVSGTDLGNKTRVHNDSETFTYNELKAMVISPTALTWPGVDIGATNETSDNDPTLINNTGNYNGTIDITGINLLGQTNSSDFIPVANFSIDIDTNGDAECDGTNLANNSAETITNSISNRGNLSEGGEAGQEKLYYCIVEVPSTIASQVYSTSGGGSWTIAY